MNEMKILIILADFAQVVNGKLYIMGGGWSLIGPNPTPSAIAIKIEVPWTEANRKHNLKLELLDTDYRPVQIPTPAGDAPVEVITEFEVGRPPGLIAGSPLDVAVAFNLGPLPLIPARRYIWKATINGDTHDNWQASFATRPALQTAGAVGG
jgi:hypothetical protein